MPQPLRRLVLDSPGTPGALLASGGPADRTVLAADRGNFIQENEGAGHARRSLSELFRKSFPRTGSRSEAAPSKTCAASCQRSPRGHFLSHLIYADKSLGGLSDRAWTIAHLLAVSNALCARLHLRGPHQLLTPIHNHDNELSIGTSWDRYFDWGDRSRGGFDTPLRLKDSDFDEPPIPGDIRGAGTGCGRKFVAENSTDKTILGPSRAQGAIREDLAAAAASDKPFEWCLDFNFRAFLGAPGFDNGKESGVPHEWCGMSSAWLAGSEDVTSTQMGEFSLGPSP